ncbi:CRISPR-associated protein cas7/cst2/devr, subtype I-b/tneap [Eggerthia catenaformis OT 569 = DSM 20559]|uniref:CRISPR-associated protein cas7/cst2/devr, subtype I-b/tneap n=1 Tax=Eggerthia catenaformis OT 569 = DSM 20559 TaxID=999415 RepID=M2Q0U4_9FIRM|nr:type I-B CRISPR-associated protein Cas7/Cst2/DevR [Eggerthia catenaformis]EMD15916.1 CRISPR-associated protein cas7/cst2/devr, subtype I-b/tneap [Eggerthia catenaformis OT 569 = DSM 20559]OUC52414.1 type I-B CRISPR-associated protein Cas7/Cst2/DevR [Eggerthia catenaformis]
MNNKALTLTVVANMTSNYGEGLGNIGSIQKVYRNGKSYAIRSRESLKNAIMVQSGLYDDLKVQVDKSVNQKAVSQDINASTNRALEGGYMNTSDNTKIRKSSFYLTDAVSFHSFINETRFHNNLYLAQAYAKENKINLQDKAKEAGLMPYQYEYDKSLKRYSITIDLDKIGVDENYEQQADKEEKIFRVQALLDAVKSLSLIVKGNMDNAEPVFIVGGIGKRKTHYFENVVQMDNLSLKIGNDLKKKINEGYHVGLLDGYNFENEEEIKAELNPVSIEQFFEDLNKEVRAYYESSAN